MKKLIGGLFFIWMCVGAAFGQALSAPTFSYQTGVFLNTDGVANNYQSIGASPIFQKAEQIQLIPGNISAVVLSGASPNLVCYTTDGTTPTAVTAGTCSNGTAYTYGVSTPPTINANVTLKAISTAVGSANSSVTSSNITILNFYPQPGTYAYSPQVALSGVYGGNVIYTLDGTTPTADGSCNATHGTAIANSATVTISTTSTLTAISCKGGVTAPLSGSPSVYTIRAPITWYVDTIGGTRFSSNVPTGQCNGQADAAYPGSGTNQSCAFSDFRYLWDDDSGLVGAGQWVIAGGDTVMVKGCTASVNQVNPSNPNCRVGWDQGGGGGSTNQWCMDIGNNTCYNPTIPIGDATHPTRFLGKNYASLPPSGQTDPSQYGSQLTQIFGGFALYYTFNLQDTQNVFIQGIDFTTHNGGTATFTGTVTSGSPIITAVSSTSGLTVGDAIEVPGTITPIPAAAHIASIGSGTITLDSNAVASASGITITDISTCFDQGDVGWPKRCNRSSGSPPASDYANSGLLLNRNTSITLQDVWIHGFTGSGIFGPFGNVTLTRVNDSFNAHAGWDPDDGNSTPDGPNAAMTGDYVTMIGSGCQQEYPIVHAFPALQCLAAQHAGFGDAFSGQDTQISGFTCRHCNISFNTKDGTIGPHPLAASIDIENSHFEANAGSSLKWISAVNGTLKLLNNEVNGNCPRWTDTVTPIPGAPQTYWQSSGLNGAYMTNGDACRAGGDAMAANLQPGATWTLANNTWTGNPAEHMAFNCGIAYYVLENGHGAGNCNTATLNLTNNIFLGYYTSPGTVGPTVLDVEDSSISPTWAHNIDFGNKPGTGPTCGSGGNLCTTPLLVSQPIQQAWTNQIFLDNFNFNLTNTSPAITAGVTYTGILSTDYAGNAQTSPPTIGALVLAGGTPTAATPTFLPVAGTYTGTQTVTISTTSAGAILCWNTTGAPATNGSTSCTAGTLYSGPVTVSASETLYAVAGGTGYLDSSVGSAAYVINPPPTPSVTLRNINITGAVTIQ